LADLNLVEVKLIKDILEKDKRHRIRIFSLRKDKRKQITSKFKKKIKMTPITL